MKEIELKARVHDFELLTNRLAELGCIFSEPLRQDDIIFDKPDYGREGRNVLRIRASGGKTYLTLKRDVSGELDSIEKEVEVSDANLIREVIELLGFVEQVRVGKNRRKCKYGDYEICLDEVDDLGGFIEVEKMSEEDGKKIQKEITDFLISLGVRPEDLVTIGYDTMIEQKKTVGF